MDITLALGGGGAKGNAHIGVLRVLDREGFRIRAIAGTSAGGLWGSLYAAGYTPDEIEAELSQIDHDTIYDRSAGDGPAMLGLAGVRKILREKLGKLNFNQLRVPFAVTAVDIDRAELVILRDGPVMEAVLATIAVPGVFPPKRIDGRMLVDGGVLDPVPVALARSLAPGLPVVAVVLSPKMNDWMGPEKPRLFESLPFLSQYIARLRVAQAFNIFVRSVDIGGVMMTELRLQVDRPDVIIRPDVPRIGLLDRVDVTHVARLGERATEAALPHLRRAVSWRGRLSRRLSAQKVPVRFPGGPDGA
jgi:NTE family protein